MILEKTRSYSNKKFFRIIFLVVAITVLLQTLNYKAYAAGSDIGFYVSADIPKNQVDSKATYFDLRMSPEEKQTINVEVNNTSDTKLNFRTQVNDASTNSVGSVEYQLEGVRDESMKYSLTEIATIREKEFSIEPRSCHVLSIELEMPKQEFLGELVGGIIITKINEEAPAEGISISNVYSYVVGLRITENDNIPKPSLELVSVKADSVNFRPTIVHEIRNTVPAILENATMKIEVFTKDDQRLVWEHNQENLKIAPTSLMKHNMYIDSSTVNMGSYVSKVHIKGEQGEWFFEQEFEIKENQLNLLQDLEYSSASMENNSYNKIILAIGIIILLIILVLLYLIYRSFGSTKEENSEEEDS